VPDSNFTNAISDLVSRSTTLIATASAKELYNITNCIKMVKQTDDSGVETALNTRINTLLGASPTLTDKEFMSGAIANMLENSIVTGVKLPTQSANNGKYLQTNSMSTSWTEITHTKVDNLNLGSPSSGDTIHYTSGTTSLDNTPLPNLSIRTFADTAALPSGAAATNGEIVLQTDISKFKIYDGSAWRVIG
jgi:hypothetical protein|tara:strand:+ start:861 stop:1436 length:576 start_codon:yes stop_codon:yes gene_type:complete